MEKLSDPVVIGTITSPHGVRGTVRVRPTGSGRHLREGIEPMLKGARRRIVRSRQTPRGFLVDFEGVRSRNAVDALRGEEILLDRSELDEPEEGDFYVSDLIGLEAVDEAGSRIGVVVDTLETPAHEVLVVREEAGARDSEIYVPFTLRHVPDVNLEARSITVRPPEE